MWLDGGRPAPRAVELVAALDSAEALGLRPADYGAAQVETALRSATSAASSGLDAQSLARADVALTASFVAIVDDLLTGRLDPRRVEPSWHIGSRAFDVTHAPRPPSIPRGRVSELPMSLPDCVPTTAATVHC